MQVSKSLTDITLLDIYNAVECVNNGVLFNFYGNSNYECPVGRNIHNVLDNRLEQIQNAMEKEMAAISMQDIMNDTEMCILKQF